MNHWAGDLVGKPWAFGAQGPDVFDCWGFVRFVQKHHYQIEVPEIGYAHNVRETAKLLVNHTERDNWVQVKEPEDGDLVMMARNSRPMHIGVWIKANGTYGVLHCLEGIGVVFQAGRTLSISGWGSFQYFRHKHE